MVLKRDGRDTEEYDMEALEKLIDLASAHALDPNNTKYYPGAEYSDFSVALWEVMSRKFREFTDERSPMEQQNDIGWGMLHEEIQKACDRGLQGPDMCSVQAENMTEEEYMRTVIRKNDMER